MALKGIDVSWYQRGINLAPLAIDFVIIKATGGDGEVNSECDPIYQQAKALGKLRGIYHYYSDGYGGADPIKEADWFVNNCRGYVNDAILVLDWEAGGNAFVRDTSKAKAWLDRVYALTGVKPIIYMSLSLVRELNWAAVIAGGYGLWVASWPNGNNVVANFGMDPNQDPNPHWDGNINDVLWQFTSTGRVDGYGGNLDCNFFYGDAKAWAAYAGAKPVTPPPTTTTTLPPPPPTTTTTVAPPTTTTTTVVTPTTTTTTVAPPTPVPTTNLWAWVTNLISVLTSWLKSWHK